MIPITKAVVRTCFPNESKIIGVWTKTYSRVPYEWQYSPKHWEGAILTIFELLEKKKLKTAMHCQEAGQFLQEKVATMGKALQNNSGK